MAFQGALSRCHSIVLLGALAVRQPGLTHAQTKPIVSATHPAHSIGVAPQYGATYVYVPPEEMDRFVASFLGTFGGKSTPPVVVTVTPTPSSTSSQLLQTPVGNISLFGFRTAIPFPFGAERTGSMVTNMDAAVRAAAASGADILVSPFPDAIGRDAIIQWPGGLNMQLYRHTTPSSARPLQSVPENRVYVSPGKIAAFLRSFLQFSKGRVTSDEVHAAGVEIGRPADSYRRVRIESAFGKMTVLVTDGHLPYPYGRETTGYEVADLPATLEKAKALGVVIVVPPYSASGRTAAFVRFPGGYIAEIHSGRE